jgi:hypothetical protein
MHGKGKPNIKVLYSFVNVGGFPPPVYGREEASGENTAGRMGWMEEKQRRTGGERSCQPDRPLMRGEPSRRVA